MKITRFSDSDVASTGSSGGPTGPAGGDLGGGYPNPPVTGIQGTPICTDTPVLNDVLTFDGTSWCPAPGGSSDHKVSVDGSDTTPNYLYPKLAAGSGISLAILSPGGDEQVEISAASGGSSGGFDVTPPLSNAMPAWVKPTGSGSITADPQGRVTVATFASSNVFAGALAFLEGELHHVYVEGSSEHASDSVLKYARSGDYGVTWSTPTTILSGTTGRHCTDPQVTALSSGRLLATVGQQKNGTPADVEPWMLYSDNRGQSWSSATLIPSTASGTEVYPTGQCVEMPDASILMPGTRTNPTVLESILWKSTDGGLTFPTQITVASNPGVREYTELQMRHVASGVLVGLMRCDTNQHTWRVTSTDGGATWSSPADVLTASGEPNFTEFYPNALLLFCRNNNTQFYPRWAVSWDAGATWTSLNEVDSSETREQDYATLLTLAPGYVIALYSLANSTTSNTIYIRRYYDGYGTDSLGNVRALIGGTLVSTTPPTAGQTLTATSTTASAWQTPTASSGTDHEHINNVVFSGDGSTTVFELPAAPFDAYSVSVYVAGSRSQDWTLSGGALTTITFGSAPASSANNIVIDIVAAVA